MDFATSYDNYLNENDLDRCEGMQGVINLEQLARDLGYRYSDPIHKFLADNPGAIEAIHDWIRDTALTEWYDRLGLENFEDEDEEV